jgi:hypothetical protein
LYRPEPRDENTGVNSVDGVGSYENVDDKNKKQEIGVPPLADEDGDDEVQQGDAIAR